MAMIDEKAVPNQYRRAVSGNGGGTRASQCLRAPLPNLLLRKPILLSLRPVVHRTRAVSAKPSRQDKRPQQKQSGRHASRFRGCVSSRARGRRFRRCNDKLRLPRMKINATLFALLLIIAVPANAERIDPADIWVIDGDTIQIYRQHPNVRLVGFNAPETRNAAC